MGVAGLSTERQSRGAVGKCLRVVLLPRAEVLVLAAGGARSLRRLSRRAVLAGEGSVEDSREHDKVRPRGEEPKVKPIAANLRFNRRLPGPRAVSARGRANPA